MSVKESWCTIPKPMFTSFAPMTPKSFTFVARAKRAEALARSLRDKFTSQLVFFVEEALEHEHAHQHAAHGV